MLLTLPLSYWAYTGLTMTLSKRKLGRQGLEVSSIGLGCMGMSQSYGPADEAESIATLHRSIELGCTFFDTAQVYGPLINEELLGRLRVDADIALPDLAPDIPTRS